MTTAVSFSKLSISLVLLLVATIAAGCGPQGDMPTAQVKGKVTYQGNPVSNGTVMFVPASGPPAVGVTKEDGTYTLGTYGETDGAVLGSHKVSITVVPLEETPNPEASAAAPKAIIPPKYQNQDTSGLTAEVKEGENEHNFELTD